ncbi:hypothetical protein YPPY66_1632, partial [Yersinia pestis PY-66]
MQLAPNEFNNIVMIERTSSE